MEPMCVEAHPVLARVILSRQPLRRTFGRYSFPLELIAPAQKSIRDPFHVRDILVSAGGHTFLPGAQH